MTISALKGARYGELSSPFQIQLVWPGVPHKLIRDSMFWDAQQHSWAAKVCDHSVIGRVRIKRILNPSNWFDRSTYLRAETVAIEDTDPDEDCWQMEGQVA